jgi:hypothetical protein
MKLRKQTGLLNVGKSLTPGGKNSRATLQVGRNRTPSGSQCSQQGDDQKKGNESRKWSQEVMGREQKTCKKPPPTQPACWLVLDSHASRRCPFLCYHSVYSTGTLRSRMLWIVAQTMVRQLNAAREHVNLGSRADARGFRGSRWRSSS